MSVLDDPAELDRIAHEVNRVNRRNRGRPVDYALIAVISVAGLALILWMPLVVAPRDYPVEAWRFMLTLASAVTAATPGLAGMYVLNRSNQRRHDAEMEKLDSFGGRVRWDRHGLAQANGRTLSPSEYYQVYSDVMKDLGDIPES